MNQSEPYLSIVIPAYNEAKRIPLTLVDIDKHLSNADYPYEILVVNDGSKDNTAEVVRKMVPTIRSLVLIDNEKNKGKGGVVRQGMLAARGKIRLFMDADNATTIDHFEKMRPYFSEKYDVVIGSRAVKGSTQDPPEPLIRQIAGKVGNLQIQIVNLPGVWDSQCGFKAFSAPAAQKIFSLSRIDGFALDIEILALARHFGFKIKEIPVHWVDHATGSTVHLKDYLKVFLENLKIRWWILTGVYGKN